MGENERGQDDSKGFFLNKKEGVVVVLGKIGEEQVLEESVGFGFRHAKFEMPVQYSGGTLEEAAGYTSGLQKKYICTFGSCLHIDGI